MKRLLALLVGFCFLSPLFSLDERVPIDPNFSQRSEQRRLMDQDRSSEAAAPVFHRIRYFESFGYSMYKEEENFQHEIPRVQALNEAHYKVFYHLDQAIEKYEYYTRTGGLKSFVKYYYANEAHTRLSHLIKFSAYGKPLQVKLYRYDQTRLSRIEAYEIREDAEVIFLHDPNLTEQTGYLYRIQRYQYEPFGNIKLVTRIEEIAIPPTRLENQIEHSSVQFNTTSPNYAQYEQFREIYARLKPEHEETISDLIQRGDVLSFTQHYYNEERKLVRKEQYFDGNLAYYFLYYYQNQRLRTKELYTETGRLLRTYQYG